MQSNLPRHSRGFTLIEMIAAFVIFAIAVGALMQILTLSMNNARFSRDETRAALWAQSLLDTVGVGERVEEGSSSGEFDRDYRWQMEIDQIDPEIVVAEASQVSTDAANVAQALATAQGQGLGMPQIDLFHVVVTVNWGSRDREHSARFSTLRTATSESAASRVDPGADARTGVLPRNAARSEARKPATGGRR